MILYGAIGSVVAVTIWDVGVKRWNASQGSNQDRLNLIVNGYEMLVTSPLVGVGPKGYSSTGLTKVTDAHNALINILAEYGILGLSAYIAFLAYIFTHFIPRIMKYSRDIGYFLFVYVLSIQLLGMTTGLTYSDKISWIILGCILGVQQHSDYCQFSSTEKHSIT